MAKNEAKIKFVAETGQFNEDIKKANSTMASMNAVLKLNEAQFKNNGDEAEYLKNKHNALEVKLEANERKQEALNAKLEVAKKCYGEDSNEVQNLSTQLTKAKTDQANLENAIAQCEKEMEAQARESQQSKTALENLTDTIDRQKEQLNKLKDEYKNAVLEEGKKSNSAKELKKKIEELDTELGKNEEALKKAGKEVESAGEKAEKSANGGWTTAKQVFADLASKAIQQCIDKIKEVAKEAIQLGIDFSSSMSNVQALSGATEDELAQLEESARSLGASTVFSASEVSDAFGYMALAGWNTEDMLNGIEGVLNLAAAADMDLATASDIVTDGLTAFGLTASDSAGFVDVLASAMANSNTNVEMLGEAFKYVGPIAGSMGYSINDVSLALGTMANSGIKASQGGTSLRRILQNMISPTDSVQGAMDRLGVSMFNSDGTARPLREVLENLRNSLSSGAGDMEAFSAGMEGLTQQYEEGRMTEEAYNEACQELALNCGVLTDKMAAQDAAAIAGTTGLSGLMAIVNASDEDWNNLANTLDGATGSAENMANTMNDNLGGDLKELNSVFEEFKLTLFDGVENPMRDATQFLTENVVPAMQKAAEFLNEHPVLMKVVGVAITALVAGLAALAVVVGVYTVAQWAMNAAVLANPITWVVVGIVAAIAAVIAIGVLLYENWDKIKAKCAELVNALKEKFLAAKEAITKPIIAAKDKVMEIVNAIKGFFTGMKLSFPAIKLPHFQIKPKGWQIGDLLKGKIPSLGIEWYAKGGILTRPTIFGMNGNKIMAGGEAGPEAILPISRLEGYIGNAIAKAQRVLNFNNLATAIERLADRAIELKVNDRVIAETTASASDSVNGRRSQFRSRGLILA